jgi:hypothetical protein
MHTQAMEDLEIDPLEAAELAAELNEQRALAENIREKLTQPLGWPKEGEARALAELEAALQQEADDNQKP